MEVEANSVGTHLSKDDYSLVSNQQPIFWDGNIPKPKGIVASKAAKTQTEKQVQQCKEIIALLNDDTAPTLKTINQATSILPFIISIPGCTHQVKVLYGIGTSSGLTGLNANKLGDDVLALYSELDPLFFIPQAIQLPKETIFPRQVKVPSMAQFQLQHKKANQSGPGV